MSISSAVRNRTASTLLLLLLVALALLVVPAIASADPTPTPYPPGSPSSGVASTSAARTNPSAGSTHQTESTQTASTGFQTLAATAIAAGLLGGGAALVLLGRRRRHG